MKLLRWAALPAVLASLALSGCSGGTTKAVVTAPSPIAVESPSPQADTFDAGLAKASDASYTATSAETSEDWDLAVSRWQSAIELMQGVPTGSANYAQAQTKLSQYQRNLVAAQSRTTPKEVASEPETTAQEPESEPAVSNSSVSNLTDDQKDQVFLLVLNTKASSAEKAWAGDVSGEQKISLAHSSCEAFEKGATFQDIALKIYEKVGSNRAGMTYMGRLIGAGIAAYCPQHKDKLPS